MTPTEKKAREIFERFKEEFELYGIGNVWTKKSAKKHALICVDRNIIKYTELLNRMDDFSNESRKVICQLLDDELELKEEILKL